MDGYVGLSSQWSMTVGEGRLEGALSVQKGITTLCRLHSEFVERLQTLNNCAPSAVFCAPLSSLVDITSRNGQNGRTAACRHLPPGLRRYDVNSVAPFNELTFHHSFPGRGHFSIVTQMANQGAMEDMFSLCYGGMEKGNGMMVLGADQPPSDMHFTPFDPARE